MPDDEELSITMRQGVWTPLTGKPFFEMRPMTDAEAADLKRRWSETPERGRLIVLPSPRPRRRHLVVGALVVGFWVGMAVMALTEWVASRG